MGHVPSSGAPAGVAPPVSPGDILAGKYRVERVLGVGGMGVVVAATHIDLLERRAIKFMLPAQLSDAEAVERFLREARASSRLKSEHVAKVHDVGRLENGAPYMVMEYLTGGDLRATLKRRGAIPAHEAALYVLQACEALAEAHGAGIIHRDVKPENLFLTKRHDGTPAIKVLDFGISKVIDKNADLAITSTTAIMGSPYYMSPEQLRSSRDVDARADIWSLGVILYQLVTNKLPFKGENLTALIALVLVGRYVPASQVRPELGGALDRVIARCLDRDIDRRYPSVAELAEDLLPFAPPAASQTVERILRLLRPNSSSPSNRLVLSSYDAPASGPKVRSAGDADADPPSSTELADMPEIAVQAIGADTDRSPAPTLERSGDMTRRDASPNELRSSSDALHSSDPLRVSGSTTHPSGPTLRSGDVAEAAAPSGRTWGNGGVESVRVVVQPSRMPVVILAAGGALALVIASLALLLGRGSSSAGPTHAETPELPSVVPTPPPATTVTPAAAATHAEEAPATASATAPGPTAPSISPVLAGSRHLPGKLPTKPAGTGEVFHGGAASGPTPRAPVEPNKPPASDPFGQGRQ